MKIRHSLLSSLDPSSLWTLSVLWLALCTSLVTQKPQFLHVFYAFVGCWLVVGVLLAAAAVMIRLGRRRRTLTKEDDELIRSKLHHHKLSPRRAILQQPQARIIRHVVALLALTTSLLMTRRTRITSIDDEASSSHSYSMLAGYLAFDHWFSSVYKLDKSLAQLVQDTLALTLALVLLATLSSSSSSTSISIAISTVAQACERVGGLAYRSVSLWQHASALYQTSATNNVVAITTKSLETAIVQTPVVDDQTTPESTATPPPADADAVWIVHGIEYNLTAYMDRHPGGKEALLLGRSRDCTALVESYHPFGQNLVRQVLQKYRVRTGSSECKTWASRGAAAHNQTTGEPSTQAEQEDDEFYQVLCRRVQATLQSKGIDPIRDRTATPLRSMYYGVVILCVLVSGYAHCQVRTTTKLLFSLDAITR
jgi:cytochrome b involved in lipid metabolism